MTKALAVILALVVLALGWQSWRMKEASQTIERQGRDLKTTGEKLAKTNSQLIALSILSETNNREQARLLRGGRKYKRAAAKPSAQN